MSNNWKKRLLNHGEKPPEGLWESIASRLDNDNWKERLANHEEKPPRDLWANIAAELDGDKNEVPVISIEKGRNKIGFWKMAVAASIASIIVISTFIIYKKPGADKSLAEIPTAIQPKDTGAINQVAVVPATPLAITKTETAAVIKKRINPAPHKQNINGSANDSIELDINFVPGNEVAALATDPSKIKADKLNNADGNEVNDIAYMSVPNTYITITGPNGETVKVSSKFSKVINSITDRNTDTEEYIDQVIKESKFWKGKFKSWRDKMSNNMLAPSPTNFMDIIELCKLVNE